MQARQEDDEHKSRSRTRSKDRTDTRQTANPTSTTGRQLRLLTLFGAIGGKAALQHCNNDPKYQHNPLVDDCYKNLESRVFFCCLKKCGEGEDVFGGVGGETFCINPNPNTTQSKIFDKESTQQICCCVLKTPFLSKPTQLGPICVVKTLRPPLPKSFRNPRFSRSSSPHGRFNGWNRPFCLVFPQRRVAKKFDEKTGSAPAWRFSQHLRGGALVDDWTDVSLARSFLGGHNRAALRKFT